MKDRVFYLVGHLITREEGLKMLSINDILIRLYG